ANRATTRLPSHAGVGAAMQVLGCDAVGPVAQMVRCQSFFPLLASKARTCSRSWRGPLEAVRKTRPPATTGLDTPRPGSGPFQATFLSGPNVAGIFSLAATPVESVPRN